MSGAGSAFERHLLVAVDAVGYGSGNDRAHVAVQAGLTGVLSKAAARSKLDRGAWLLQPQGDGELAILPHDQPEPVVVDDYVRHIARALAVHNNKTAPEGRIRLRMAIHHGTAMHADNGYAGQGVVAVSRLIDSLPVREALAATPDADLALILSRQVFLEIVRGGHVSFNEGDFTPVRVRVKEYTDQAWVTTLGERTDPTGPVPPNAGSAETAQAGTPQSTTLQATAREPDASRAREYPPQQVNNVFNGDVHAEEAVFGFNYGPRGERLCQASRSCQRTRARRPRPPPMLVRMALSRHGRRATAVGRPIAAGRTADGRATMSDRTSSGRTTVAGRTKRGRPVQGTIREREIAYSTNSTDPSTSAPGRSASARAPAPANGVAAGWKAAWRTPRWPGSWRISPGREALMRPRRC